MFYTDGLFLWNYTATHLCCLGLVTSYICHWGLILGSFGFSFHLSFTIASSSMFWRRWRQLLTLFRMKAEMDANTCRKSSEHFLTRQILHIGWIRKSCSGELKEMNSWSALTFTNVEIQSLGCVLNHTSACVFAGREPGLSQKTVSLCLHAGLMLYLHSKIDCVKSHSLCDCGCVNLDSAMRRLVWQAEAVRIWIRQYLLQSDFWTAMCSLLLKCLTSLFGTE